MSSNYRAWGGGYNKNTLRYDSNESQCLPGIDNTQVVADSDGQHGTAWMDSQQTCNRIIGFLKGLTTLFVLIPAPAPTHGCFFLPGAGCTRFQNNSLLCITIRKRSL